MKTPEQIYQNALKKSDTNLGLVRIINKQFRAMDESHLWPISNKFNATERAIRQARQLMRDCGEVDPLAYALTVEHNISMIVNDDRNWK